MKRVMVAPWGKPFQWWKIKYRVECSKLGVDDCQEVEMENVSTLPALVKAFKPDKTIIFVLDSLANLKLKNPVEPKELDSYDAVVEDVEERVRWFIENQVKPLMDEDDRSLLDDVEIVVLPGVGEFDNASVDGNVIDFYSAVLKALAERLPAEDVEVFLDLTHGINFMPVLTYRALKNLLGLLAYIHTAKLYVLNSEPFPQGEPSWREKIVKSESLNLLSVEELELEPKPLYSTISDRKDWSAFISSVTNGFPLVFTRFYPKFGEVKEYMEGGFSEFIEGIRVGMAEDVAGRRKVHITREDSLGENFRTAAKLYYMLRVFNPVLNKDGTYPKRDGTLDELFRITKTLFIKMPRIGVVVEEQLCGLERLQREVDLELGKKRRSRIGPGTRKRLESKKGILLSDLYREIRPSYSSGGMGLNPAVKVRNFIAHSGFEFNLTKVRVENVIRKNRVENAFVFSYSDEETVIDLSVKALRYGIMRR